MIDDMPTMATYVSNLYEERVKYMIDRYNAMKGGRKPANLKAVQKIPETVSTFDVAVEIPIKVEATNPVEKMDVEEEHSGEEGQPSTGFLGKVGKEVPLPGNQENEEADRQE